ncbi:MAG: hypothetical protein WBP72_11635 [Rhodocyclaceae bacterium]|jgi:hypothetical protein
MEDVLSKTALVYGLAIVVSMAIAAVIKLIVVVLNALEPKPAAVVPAASPVPAFDLAADHVAAIAAAVYATLGSARIVHIEPSHRGSEWLAEGRQAQHGSHHISHHPAR